LTSIGEPLPEASIGAIEGNVPAPVEVRQAIAAFHAMTQCKAMADLTAWISAKGGDTPSVERPREVDNGHRLTHRRTPAVRA
jgi:hypothetical protein